MGTTQNTAALYLRKSSLDDRDGEPLAPFWYWDPEMAAWVEVTE